MVGLRLPCQTSLCDPRSSSQLRVTSVSTFDQLRVTSVSTFDQLRVTSVSTFDRARCEAPSLAPGFDHCFSAFQLAGTFATGQYTRAVSKQRKRPQTGNRHEGIKSPPGVEHGGNGCSGLWTRHYRKVIAASVNLRLSQLEAAASYFAVDVRPAPIPQTSFIDLCREQRLL